MSSYFDDYAARVRELDKSDPDLFIRAIGNLEIECIDPIIELARDHEFPADLAAEINTALSRRVVASPEARKWAQLMGYSKIIEQMHDIFHKVAQRRVHTRFGMLFDNPRESLNSRKEWEIETVTEAHNQEIHAHQKRSKGEEVR